MGTIIEFPADATSRRSRAVAGRATTGSPATVVILPVVRIERHTDGTKGGNGKQEGAASGRRRRRR